MSSGTREVTHISEAGRCDTVGSSVGFGELESVCLLKGICMQVFHKHCAEQIKLFWAWI